MKTKLPFFVALLLLCFNTNAQDGYSFSLERNTDYNYSIVATANFSSIGGSTATPLALPDLFEFAVYVMLPDGAEIDALTITTPYGTPNIGGVFDSATLGANDPVGNRSARSVGIDQGNGLGFPEHNIGDVITVATFDVTGTPTAGEISLLDSSSILAGNAGGLFDPYMLIDIIDDGNSNTPDVILGLTGTTSFSFATLGVDNNKLANASIYPNPVNDVLNIKGLDAELERVSIYSINGQQVMTQTANLERIITSSLAQGVYFVELKSLNAVKTLKIVKN
jgi:hypothetical protein